MIRAVTEDEDFASVIRAISSLDPFACRILSLWHCYRPTLVFVDYWCQVDDGNGAVTGAVARSGSQFILFLTDTSDLDEMSSFMRIAGATSVLCSGSYDLDINMSLTTGEVLICNDLFEEDDRHHFVEPDLHAAYDLISDCADENFQPPVFEDFYVDVNHKMRHHAARLFGIECGGNLASVAMTVAESANGAVLGAVACAHKYRRCGYGSAVVKRLTNSLIHEGKNVFLHRAQNANVSFYSELGFSECGTWNEYK